MSIPVATITNVTTGQTLPNTVDVQELEIHRALNRIPTAKLHLLDGSVAKRTFQISESNFFGPGYRIRIALRYEGKTQDTTLFEGLVLRHAVESTSEGTSMR
ncbi:MAG TPA: hypothetical protein PLA94_21275, partial [Myxococcota bacterium]|nr:hypothetical protein [Myxococcota bacterium]